MKSEELIPSGGPKRAATLLGPTAPAVWMPLGPRVRSLQGQGLGDEPFAGLTPALVLEAAAGWAPPSTP